jgi:MFS family permease
MIQAFHHLRRLIEMKNNIKLMYGIAFLQGLVFYAPIATLYRTSAGLSLFDISLIESISYVLMIVFEIPWGVLADRIGYRRTMIICSLLYFLSKIIFWQADTFLMFLTERILISIVFAGLSGVDTSILYLSAEEGQSQKVFSIFGTLGTMGMIAASFVCAVFVGTNYRFAGWLTIFPYALAAVLPFFLQEVKQQEEKKQTVHHVVKALKETVHNHRFLLLIISGGVLSETVHMITVFLNQPKYTETGMDASAISLVYIAMMLVGLLEVYSARFAKRTGKRMAGIILFACAIAASIMLAFTSKAYIAVISIGIVNIVYALFQPLFSACEHDSITAADRATVISAGALIADAVAVIIDLVMGQLADISLTLSFLAGGAFLLVGGILFALVFQRKEIA